VHVTQPDGSVAATPIVEVKNLNSIRGVERALKYEAQRQANELRDKLAAGEWRLGPAGDTGVRRVQAQKSDGTWADVAKTTAGWDDDRGRTNVQRRKEEASDYRYFPDPDLVPVAVDAAWLAGIRDSLGELPARQRSRLRGQYGLSVYDADVLTRQGRGVVAYFEEAATACGDAKAACNWITNKLLASVKDADLDGKGAGEVPFPVSAAALAELIGEQKALGLTKQVAEQVFDTMLADGLGAKQAVAKLGIQAVDAGELVEIVRQAIADNPKAVEDYKKGKTAAAQRIKGAVMKATKGTAKPDVVDRVLAEELAKV